MSPLCRILSQLLPRLTHLQLNALHIPTLIFNNLMTGQVLPNLRSLCLEITSLMITAKQYEVYASEDLRFALQSDDTPERLCFTYLQMSRNSQALPNLIARELRRSCEAGRFLSNREMQLSVVRELHPTRFGDNYLWCSFNILEQRTLSQQIICLQVPARAIDSMIPIEAWAFKPKAEGKVTVIDESQIDDCVGNFWISSSTGVRFPRSERNSRKVRRFSLEWLDSLDAGLPPKNYMAKYQTEGHSVRNEQHEYEAHFEGLIRGFYPLCVTDGLVLA